MVISWVLISVFLFLSTFVFYAAIMKMREIRGEIYRLHWSVRWACFINLFVGLILDMLLNWIVCTIVFVELPREVLTTTRVVRHKRGSTGFRHRLALWFCKNWLTPFDQSHCE